MKLNQLSENDGATRDAKRVGRGIGSGTGKTSGRGHKGQKARSGVSIKGFEGGQMPLYRRLPKFGFTNPTRKEYEVVNLGRLQGAIDAKKLDAAAIDEAALIKAGLASGRKEGVRILAQGDITAKVQLTVSGASRSAIEAIEKAGGSVTTTVEKKVVERKGGRKVRAKDKKPAEASGNDS
jgi:large subunit ribosomal protein L15